MSASQPVTFVLVPGSFVTPEEYDKMVTLLTGAGHTVRTVELLTANDGSRLPPATFSDDVSHIRSALLEILDHDKRNVVLALHSYAGVPGSSAVSGLTAHERKSAGHDTAVIGMVYIASLLPLLNESLRDIIVEYMPENMKIGTPGEYLPPTPREFAPFIFNDIADPAEMKKYYGLMVRHASDSYSGKATYEAWKDIESVQIIPQQDLIIPVALQEGLFQRSVEKGGKVRRAAVDAGHCVNVSQPEFVVGELLKVAGL